MTWTCPNCSVENETSADRCSCCEDPKPKNIKEEEEKKPVKKKQPEPEDEEEYEGESEDDEMSEDELSANLRESSGFDSIVGASLAKEAKSKAKLLVTEAKKALGDSRVVAIEDEDTFFGRVKIPLNFIDATVAKVWGMKPEQPIILELKFNLENYMEEPPTFLLYQSSDTDLTRNKLKSISSFGLEWQLRSRLDMWLNGDKKDKKPTPNWPPKADNKFISQAVDHVIMRIKDCTKTCIICDGLLPFQMIKPSVCGNQLCVHIYEQYGLGADVASEIRDSADVVDALISFLFAMVGGDVRRFNPYPFGVEIKRRDEQLKEITESFAKEDGSKNPQSVKRILELFPPISELSTLSDTKTIKAILDEKHILAFPLLRWIITSNRAHLVRLEAKDRIPEMNTDYQYMFLSSPPERESEFQQLKKKHGSFWAFHGSAFGNWHSILRIGLKNYSNTELMSTGAAYGAGIYLSPFSGTSSGYSAQQQGWPKSIFANHGQATSMQCIALCEVINAGYKANPHYVVPEEIHVMTRYFFVYNGKFTCPGVEAQKLSNVKSSPLGNSKK